ncbi:MAG: hypothetical protein M5U34_09475 [Chloroflexi bacterium]|nr:hypothetical protein [Chloroflexota bacterium]
MTLLETNHERQGQIVIEGTKEEIAKFFYLIEPWSESFARNFPLLITDVGKLPGKGTGSVRFTPSSIGKSYKTLVAR